jgi:hypothetical protein
MTVVRAEQDYSPDRGALVEVLRIRTIKRTLESAVNLSAYISRPWTLLIQRQLHQPTETQWRNLSVAPYSS